MLKEYNHKLKDKINLTKDVIRKTSKYKIEIIRYKEKLGGPFFLFFFVQVFTYE